MVGEYGPRIRLAVPTDWQVCPPCSNTYLVAHLVAYLVAHTYLVAHLVSPL